MLEFPAILKLGGRIEAHRKLTELGFENTINAMSMWRVRGQIPGDPTRLILKAAEAEGIQLQAADFELRENSDGEAA